MWFVRHEPRHEVPGPRTLAMVRVSGAKSRYLWSQALAMVRLTSQVMVCLTLGRMPWFVSHEP